MAKTPQAPANMSFLFTGRKFLLGARSPSPAVVTMGGLSPFISTATNNLVYPNFPYDPTRSIVAGSLYVDPVNGSDSANGLSQGAAKRTIAAAITAIGTSSSKYIYLMNGTHQPGRLNISSVGTQALPVTVTSLPGHAPVIDGSTVADGGRVFNLDGAAWTYWSHLSVRDWPLGMWVVGENLNTPNNRFFCIAGIQSRANSGDNCGMIHLWDGDRSTDGFQIDRFRIMYTGGSTSANTAGIYWKRSNLPTICSANHGEIFGFPVGIYHKHGIAVPTNQGNMTVSNTLIVDCSRVPAGFNPAGVIYTNCVLAGSLVRLAEADGGEAGDLNRYVHVTFGTGLWLSNQNESAQPGAQHNSLQSCIVPQLIKQSPSSIESDSDFNMYGTASGAISFELFPSITQTLAQLQAFTGGDAHSLQRDATFAGGDPRTAAYWDCINAPAGHDGQKIGADVTRIGAQAA